MLELKKITKVYNTGGFEQKALDEVSVNFRKNEFVSILGQSGSGKTTMLNIIGGLDKYTSGDLVIDGVSTKNYRDSDWDTYRNHRIGFVFQSYNLITHQSVLSNVQLALTLSGVSKAEGKRRAMEILKKVGLEDHMHKKPNQMSGGQMQRVAIARALINNPDILLADEPTGALDSDTSVQIMQLLQEIAKDKLVIMVTHNPDLATEYSTRIVKLKDGHVIDDSMPYDGETSEIDEDKNKAKSKKTSMSFKTALSLSLNNLLTKKGRTIITSFAGSIGIIGIALILSLSSGVQNYINKVQEDTLSSYPLQIEEATIDIAGMMTSIGTNTAAKDKGNDKVYSNDIMGEMLKMMTSQTQSNNLKEFKNYLEDHLTELEPYVNDIKYSYNLDLNLFKSDTSNGVTQVNPTTVFSSLGMNMMDQSMGSAGGGQLFASGAQTWTELTQNDKLLKSQYDVIAGHLPENEFEVVVILDENNQITDYALYSLGLKDQKELQGLMQSIMTGTTFESTSSEYTYEEILSLTYKLVLNTDYYSNVNGTWVNNRMNQSYMVDVVNKAKEIKVVGIIKPAANSKLQTTGGIGYIVGLEQYVIDAVNDSAIAKEQINNPDINVFTKLPFGPEESYKDNATKLGIVDLDNPKGINIFPKDFESKDYITSFIETYNNNMKASEKEELVINYTDYVSLLMSSVTTIINMISYVLIGFVSISLIVSSIMIGIITYISVLERTKEIGILRAIGASKKDISRVFNAETFIIGLSAGVLGIVITLLLNIPINLIVENLTGVSQITALPMVGGVVLVIISMGLTMFAGLMPAKMASKKDPVEALRTE